MVVLAWEVCIKAKEPFGPGRLTTTEDQQVERDRLTGGLVPLRFRPASFKGKVNEQHYSIAWEVAPLKTHDGEFTHMLIYIDAPSASFQSVPVGGVQGVPYYESDTINQRVEVKNAGGAVLDHEGFGVSVSFDESGNFSASESVPGSGGPTSRPTQ